MGHPVFMYPSQVLVILSPMDQCLTCGMGSSVKLMYRNLESGPCNMRFCSCDGIAERISDSEIGLTAAVARSFSAATILPTSGGRRCLSLELKSCQLAELIGDEASVVRDSVDRRRTRIDLVFLPPPQKIRTSSDIIVSLGRVE